MVTSARRRPRRDSSGRREPWHWRRWTRSLWKTMTDLAEALLVLEACREADSEIPVLVTLTFDEAPKGPCTSWDRRRTVRRGPGEGRRRWRRLHCGSGIEAMAAIARRSGRSPPSPFSSSPTPACLFRSWGRWIYPQTPEYFASYAPGLLDAGVSLLGDVAGRRPSISRPCAGSWTG